MGGVEEESRRFDAICYEDIRLLATKGVDADSKENIGQMPLFVRGSERVHGWAASIGLISVLDIAPCGALEYHPD
jgi:hypothetical protein